VKTLLLKLSVSVVLLTVLLARADLADLGRRLASVDPVALATGSFCIFGLSLTMALRWKAILAEFRHPLGFADLWRYTTIGMFFNQLLPSGMGGDGFRMWYARRAGLPLGAAIGTVLVDRILGLLGLLLLVLIGLPYLLSLRIAGTLATVVSASAVLLALAIVGFLFSDCILSGVVRLFRGRVITEFLQRPIVSSANNALTQMAKDTRRLLRTFRYGAATLLLSLINQIVLGLVVLYLARSLSVDLSPTAAVFLFPPVLLLSMIPISLAGWGVREGAMVLMFSLAGLRADASLSISVLFGACMFLSGLPGGMFWLLVGRKRSTAEGNLP
jgi:uncharacterized protein (TIRG00374 family)